MPLAAEEEHSSVELPEGAVEVEAPVRGSRRHRTGDAEKAAQERQKSFPSEEQAEGKLPSETWVDPEEEKKKKREGLYTLRVGDQLQISLYGEDQSMRRVMVDPSGAVSYLFVHGVPALGRTLVQVRRELTERLRQYFRDPVLLVTPVGFVGETYTLLGEVLNPGLKPLKGRMTLLSALAESGGFQTRIFRDQTVDLYDLTRSFVARNGECLKVDMKKLVAGDLAQDVVLRAGDYIYIDSLQGLQVYVLGEVEEPDSIEFDRTITLLQALTEAGGITERASSRVMVIRGSLAEPETFLIDINLMMKGRAPDFELKPSDIVYVPPRMFTHLREILRAGLRDFVGTVMSQAGNSTFIWLVPDAAGETAPTTALSF